MSTDTIRPDEPFANPPVGALAEPYPGQAIAAVKPGSIVLARHGEPGLSRKVRLNAAEYVAWWARYEETGLLPGQTPPDCLVEVVRKADLVFCSTRIRAIETARAVTLGRKFEIDPTLIEAPLPLPRWPSWFRLSPKIWGFISRSGWWFLNYSVPGEETRDQAKVRSDEVAARLDAMAAAGNDVVVLAHGFFNTMIGLSLKRMGWKLVDDQGWRYWCGRRFERP